MESSSPEARRILDHHFPREQDNFPSASAAVMHFARKLDSWAKGLPAETQSIWLTTHQSPDFDALCAVTLAETILWQGAPEIPWDEAGIGGAGWSDTGRGRFSWFEPDMRVIPERYRWMFWLAAAASASDQCKRIACPPNRTLSAFLRAAQERGRNVNEPDFRRHFFTAIRNEIEAGRQPLADSVLEHNAEFAPERELLDVSARAYVRDVKRARKIVVNIPTVTGFRPITAD